MTIASPDSLNIPLPSQSLFGPGLPSVVVFDCDGVLFDSREANVRFYNLVMERFGRPPLQPDQMDYIHMHSARESLEYLLGTGPVLEEAWAFCQGLDFRMFNRYLKKEPGLDELLRYLKPRCHVALATNRTVSTRDLLASFHLDSAFDLVVTAADVSHPKPHPESMEKILKAFGAPPQHVLFVGDSQVDALLAQNTGVVFAAYKNPSLSAHLHVPSFHALQAHLATTLDGTGLSHGSATP
ncbi:HAD family hydrolase [Desulfosoma caldarium]|uniref:phosphoglycolate phosphatase n=1 Tax=Desulfosoma caldarium TaxID=610254 RepID=A0A3N1UKK8_9BACT|nr:HAD family hydrolase [Desulfosoma caldarium]ROQ90258.1 HAD superfamily hydrolase (TIGR01509 family)/HAD superfamily hydrolase (TIGR01549 family) [Desulfosoma caldarium]